MITTHCLCSRIADVVVAVAVAVLVDVVLPETDHIGRVGVDAVGGGENVVPVDQGSAAEVVVFSITGRKSRWHLFEELCVKIRILSINGQIENT